MRQQNYWPEFSDTQSQTRGTTGNGRKKDDREPSLGLAALFGCGVVIDLI